jgi:hypothetical protein
MLTVNFKSDMNVIIVLTLNSYPLKETWYKLYTIPRVNCIDNYAPIVGNKHFSNLKRIRKGSKNRFHKVANTY